MSFFRRLQTISTNRKRFDPVGNVAAGRAAELKMASILERRLRSTGYEYLAGLRVPDRKRRREIDIVITTPDEIWVVELKNWVGFVGLDDGHVIQHRSGGRGVVDHGRLLADLRRKQGAVRRYLKKRVDEVPRIWTVLVFCNERVTIDENLLAVDDLDVVGIGEFLSALPRGGQRADREVAPSISEARRVLRQLGTWDLLALYGGRILSGDVVGCTVEELMDRNRFERLEIKVARNYLDAFRPTLSRKVMAVQRSGSPVEVEFCGDDRIEFHAAGQPKPASFDLRHIEAVSFGYTDSTPGRRR